MKEIVSYDVYIDEDEMTGVDKISLVKKPAILTDFVYMADEQPEQYKQIQLQDEKQIIVGPALIPDLEIVRKDEDGEPYYIKYSKEQIERIAQKFFKFKSAKDVNKDHKENQAEDTYIYESWIVGENDKAASLGFDVPQGTWMVSMKVENAELWEKIKSGKYRGFSIEGLFKFKKSSRLVKQTCTCGDEVELEAQPGLVHPNCRCSIRRDEFRLSKPRLGKNGQPVPCEVCKNAKVSWDNNGFFEDVFEVRYTKNNQEAVNLGADFEGVEYFTNEDIEKNASNYNIVMDKVALVAPGASETQDEFISRCMGDDKMNSEFPEQSQRAAVCYAYWDEKQEKINVNMVSAILKDGKTLHTDADAMAVGVEVYFMNGENKESVDNGEYELEDGNIVVVEDSKIKEIKEMALGADYKKDEEEMGSKEKDTKMEIDPMLMEQFDALKGMIENLNLKIDALMGSESEDMKSVKQSLETLENKVEKISVEKEMKSVETIDDVKRVAQSATKKKIDYDLIARYNKKF